MNFLDTILASARRVGDRPLTIEVHGKQQRPTTGNELLALVARVRGHLRARGIKPGDRVALLAPNSSRWVAADLAILAEGAIVVPLYSRQDPRELAVMVRDCTPALVLASDPALADALAAAWPEHAPISLLDLALADPPLDAPAHPLAASDAVTIIYTSGTSGEPKGVVLDCANVDFMVPQTATALQDITGGRGEADRVFHFLPLCFAGSRIMLWTQLYRGNPILLSTDLANLAQEMGTADPHYYLNVPAVLERIRAGVTAKIREKGGLAWSLYQRGQESFRHQRQGSASLLDRLTLALARKLVFAKIKQQVGPGLEFLICGSAALAEETQWWFELIGVRVFQVYGLTETTAIVTMDQPNAIRPGHVGHALPGCELKIGDDGELLVRGPGVFHGYWNRPQATAEAIRDGWFHTGDQCDLDPSGNLKIIGRVKNILVPESGHNLAPEPIEQKFLDHCPAAAQCMLVGHARPYLLLLVPGEVPDAEIEAAIERVNADVPHYRKIKRHLRVAETFTIENALLTANQKLRRKAVEARFKADIDRVYAMINWTYQNGVYESALVAAPCNEIGMRMLAALEGFLAQIEPDAHTLIIHSSQRGGFCAGADLRELYQGLCDTPPAQHDARLGEFIDRIHRVMDTIDMLPLTTIGVVHGVCFGGGFELALTCDILIAEKSARFCFPELRLGIVPGFGGIPRLRRDVGNALIRDLLLSGRSIGAKKALAVGLVSQLVIAGEGLSAARSLAAQSGKFDAHARRAAKAFIKRLPAEELARERALFVELAQRPALLAALKRFVESTDLRPYLPERPMADTVQILINMAAKRFKADATLLRPEDDIFERLGIDSFQAVELISDLEGEFDIELPDYELQGVKTFAALAQKIDKRR